MCEIVEQIKDSEKHYRESYYEKNSIYTITDTEGHTETVSALAREEEVKKGMDGSQITGTASSYARKYCLNGLFLIDDTKDADTDAYKLQTTARKKPEPAEPEEDETPVFSAEFMQNHGRDKIGEREINRLKTACEENEKNGGQMTLKSALAHANRNRIEDLTYTQYIALMACLKCAA